MIEGRSSEWGGGGVWGGVCPPSLCWRKLKLETVRCLLKHSKLHIIMCIFHTKRGKYLTSYEAWPMVWCFKWRLLQCKLIWLSWLLRTQLSLIGIIGHMWPLMMRQMKALNRKIAVNPPWHFWLLKNLNIILGWFIIIITHINIDLSKLKFIDCYSYRASWHGCI